jgi:GNAT superfamily N-acetyltransferase
LFSSLTADASLLASLAETEYASFDDGIHAQQTPFGTFVTHPDYPDRYDCNQLLRCQVEENCINEMLQDLERLYVPAGVAFRKVVGHDPVTNEVLTRELPRFGWKCRPCLMMAWTGNQPVPTPEIGVKSVDPYGEDLKAVLGGDGERDRGFEYHRSQWKRLGGEWLVGYLDGKPAGCTGWYEVGGVVRHRWVGTMEWARRQGVATALLQHIQGLPVVKEAKALTIFVDEEIENAKRLYEKLGFQAVGSMWQWSIGTED